MYGVKLTAEAFEKRNQIYGLNGKSDFTGELKVSESRAAQGDSTPVLPCFVIANHSFDFGTGPVDARSINLACKRIVLIGTWLIWLDRA